MKNYNINDDTRIHMYTYILNCCLVKEEVIEKLDDKDFKDNIQLTPVHIEKIALNCLTTTQKNSK